MSTQPVRVSAWDTTMRPTSTGNTRVSSVHRRCVTCNSYGQPRGPALTCDSPRRNDRSQPRCAFNRRRRFQTDLWKSVLDCTHSLAHFVVPHSEIGHLESTPAGLLLCDWQALGGAYYLPHACMAKQVRMHR